MNLEIPVALEEKELSGAVGSIVYPVILAMLILCGIRKIQLTFNVARYVREAEGVEHLE